MLCSLGKVRLCVKPWKYRWPFLSWKWTMTLYSWSDYRFWYAIQFGVLKHFLCCFPQLCGYLPTNNTWRPEKHELNEPKKPNFSPLALPALAEPLISFCWEARENGMFVYACFFWFRTGTLLPGHPNLFFSNKFSFCTQNIIFLCSYLQNRELYLMFSRSRAGTTNVFRKLYHACLTLIYFLGDRRHDLRRNIVSSFLTDAMIFQHSRLDKSLVWGEKRQKWRARDPCFLAPPLLRAFSADTNSEKLPRFLARSQIFPRPRL